MKIFYTTCFYLLMFFATSAQSNTGISSLNFTPKLQLKATIHLKNTTETTGIIAQITDSTVVLLQSFKKENSVTYKNSIIAVPEIKVIKIKRDAFWLGMGCGAVVTGFVGYAVGYGSYTDSPVLSESANKDNAQAKGFGDAIIGAVPGAVIGSLVGSVIIKRKFIINGDIKNIKAMMKTLW